ILENGVNPVFVSPVFTTCKQNPIQHVSERPAYCDNHGNSSIFQQRCNDDLREQMKYNRNDGIPIVTPFNSENQIQCKLEMINESDPLYVTPSKVSTPRTDISAETTLISNRLLNIKNKTIYPYMNNTNPVITRSSPTGVYPCCNIPTSNSQIFHDDDDDYVNHTLDYQNQSTDNQYLVNSGAYCHLLPCFSQQEYQQQQQQQQTMSCNYPTCPSVLIYFEFKIEFITQKEKETFSIKSFSSGKSTTPKALTNFKMLLCEAFRLHEFSSCE
ncbi:unnamed protein product, partial [Trichobilharzia regenti]